MKLELFVMILGALGTPSRVHCESSKVKSMLEDGYKQIGAPKSYALEKTRVLEIEVKKGFCTKLALEFSKDMQWSEMAKKRNINLIERDGDSSISYGSLNFDSPDSLFVSLGCDHKSSGPKKLSVELYDIKGDDKFNIGKGEFKVTSYSKKDVAPPAATQADIDAEEKEMQRFKESNRQKACMECASRYPAKDADFNHCVGAYGVQAAECY